MRKREEAIDIGLKPLHHRCGVVGSLRSVSLCREQSIVGLKVGDAGIKVHGPCGGRHAEQRFEWLSGYVAHEYTSTISFREPLPSGIPEDVERAASGAEGGLFSDAEVSFMPRA